MEARIRETRKLGVEVERKSRKGFRVGIIQEAENQGSKERYGGRWLVKEC